MMLLFALTSARHDKDPCHDHNSDDDDDHDHGYDKDDNFIQVQHDHNNVHHHNHDLVHDRDDNDDHVDDLDQALHALLRALHKEGERKADKEISKHARGGLEY